MTALATAVLVGVGSSAGPKQAPSRQALARHLVTARNAMFLSGPARAALQIIASGDRSALPQVDVSKITAAAGIGTLQTVGSGLKNVRVNDPSRDTNEVDQTTQSEPSIAVTGKNVVVGFNDSQRALPAALTAGLDFDGYASSTDGGSTFTDRGTVPNLPGLNNIGDPWLASDRSGNVYYASLALDYEGGNLNVAVSTSTDKGKTFSRQAVVSPTDDVFYSGDKEALGVGPDPTDTSHDIVYATWDDEFLDQDFNQFSGLAVSRSTDQGRTWSVSYADQIPTDPDGCSFTQYIGAVPAVASNGTLYVAAEKASVDDPDCTGENPFVLSEVVFTSNDGGQSFDSGTQLAEITGVNYLDLGPGKMMRNLEFPSIAVGPDGAVHVVWNDSQGGGDDEFGPTNIRVATSTDSGATWDLSWLTNGPNDTVQPAVSADGKGVHVIYYIRNANNTLDVLVANSTGLSWVTKRVTTTSFPGVLTVPQFDPQLGDAYMGDYIANVSDGKNQYFAWGDNRDIVKNFMSPSGRNDPDVFLAKQ